MTPPTLTSLRLIRQQLSDAHMANVMKLDEAIANLSAPPPAPPAKTRGEAAAAAYIWTRPNQGEIVFGFRNGDYPYQAFAVSVVCALDAVERTARRNLGELIDAQCNAALAAQQEQIAKWLESNDRVWTAVDVRSGKWKPPTTGGVE